MKHCWLATCPFLAYLEQIYDDFQTAICNADPCSGKIALVDRAKKLIAVLKCWQSCNGNCLLSCSLLCAIMLVSLSMQVRLVFITKERKWHWVWLPLWSQCNIDGQCMASDFLHLCYSEKAASCKAFLISSEFLGRFAWARSLLICLEISH